MKNQVSKPSADGENKGSKSESSFDAATGLRKLFVDELKDIYWAEKALTKAIPKMIKNATSEELVDALTGHLEETEGHVTRLEEVFESIGEKAVAKKCEAMDGLTKEAEEIMGDTEKGVVRDAGIISAGQKVEHYEIATYGTLISFAKVLAKTKLHLFYTKPWTKKKQPTKNCQRFRMKLMWRQITKRHNERTVG